MTTITTVTDGQMDAAHAELALSNAIMNAAPKNTPDNPFIEPELVQTEEDVGGTPL